MIKKYYQPFPTGDSKSGGYLILDEAGDVNNPESLVMTLVNGDYRLYEILNIGTCICEEWKNTIEEFIDKDSGINFIPVQTISKEYGNRTYYLVKFNHNYDLIDYKHSKVLDNPRRITVPVLQYEKVKDLNLFRIPGTIYDFVISAKLLRKIKSKKLSYSTVFEPVWAISHDDPDY